MTTQTESEESQSIGSEQQEGSGKDSEPLQLGHLSGAVLTYTGRNGERVEVHFDE